MKLKDIIKNNPNKKFIKVDFLCPSESPNVENLQDLLDIDSTFLYTEDGAPESLESYFDNLDTDEDFRDWLKKNKKTEYEAIKEEVRHFIDEYTISSLEYDLYYSVENKVNSVDIDELIDEYEEQQEEQEALEQKERDEEIENTILNYSDEYSKATKVKDQQTIISKVQFELKNKFGLTSANDSRATKFYIETTLKNNSSSSSTNSKS